MGLGLGMGLDKSGSRGGATLPAALLAKFLFLWNGKYDGDNLLSSLDSSVITVTGREWVTRKIPQNVSKSSNGRLYNWYSLTGIAPTGWHVASDDDFITLHTFLGGAIIAGGKLKEVGLTHWVDPNFNATDEVGFKALPNGVRSGTTGLFGLVGESLYLWTILEWDATIARGKQIVNYDEYLANLSTSNKKSGFGVRLVRDTLTGYVEGETVTDLDGNVYDTVQIGTQVWLKQNWACTKYANGNAIPNITVDSEWNTLSTGAYCNYNNAESYVFEESPILTVFNVTDNATYLNADGTDDFWFTAGNVLDQKTFTELIESTTLRTFVKYTDFEPYEISAIGILKAGEVLTEAEQTELDTFFKLWVQYWGTTMSETGYMKDNRILI